MIGVFDSGYGGLSVFKELVLEFPDESFIYLGDNARAPYGIRSKEIIVEYVKEALAWFFEKGVDTVVLACNTASSEALEELHNSFLKTYPDKKVFGVIEAVVALLKKNISKSETIAVIGTPSTIRSGKYKKELERAGFKKVEEKATPLLVPLVETGIVGGAMAEHIVADALSSLTKKGVSTVVLGCTHYYFLRETILKLYPHLMLFDASEAFPSYFRNFLNQKSETMENRTKEKNNHPRFYTTDSEDDFARFVEKTLGLKIRAEKIRLV